MQLARRVFALFIALSLAQPLGAASLHPRLVKATPAADSRTADAPKQLALTFSETLDLALTRVRLFRGETQVRTDSLQRAPGDEKTIVAPLAAALTPGRYTVRWAVTGSDGHPVRGEFSFEVLPASAEPTELALHHLTR